MFANDRLEVGKEVVSATLFGLFVLVSSVRFVVGVMRQMRGVGFA